MKNIAVLYPESGFTSDQLHKLSFTGEVSYADSIRNSSLSGQVKYLKDADIVAFSPDVFGRNAKKILFEILEKSPKVKGLVLNSTNADFIDTDYCRKRNITITVVPDHTVEAVAEQTILLLLACARRMLVNSWQAQQRKYQQELGSELAGKRLGIIGVNAVSERIVKLVKPFGVRIFIWSDTPIRVEGAERKSLDEVLYMSDFVTLNLFNNEENKKFLSKERINRLKQGAMVINLSGRDLVDEKWMAEALKNGQIDQYVFETETIKSSPFDNLRRAIPLKQLSRYTQESENRSKSSWVTNIANMAGISTS